MNAYSPKEYWTGVAENSDSRDSTGYAPVLHPDAPPWFNRLIDDLQFRAVRRALELAGISAGSSVLDVGCGTGRWVRRYREIGLHPTGMDSTPAMLRLARQHQTASPLAAGEAFRLPFAGGAFDSVSDITVVQHIPAPVQTEALKEMLRVLKPGGSLILFELIRGTGAHIFPRDPQDWIQQVASLGAKLVGWFGQEFLLFDRALVWLARAVAGRNGSRADAFPFPAADAAAQRRSTSHRLYWELRHVTAPLSAWLDPATEKIFPAHFATHGVFVFRK